MKYVLLLSLLLAGCGQAEVTSSCSMNGFGSGHCQFTNRGDAAASLCGNVEVRSLVYPASKSSSVFCTGDIDPESTKEMAFRISLGPLCDMPGETRWVDHCDWQFVPLDDGAELLDQGSREKLEKFNRIPTTRSP